MQFKEFKIPNIPYHETLNPLLWTNEQLMPDVRFKLLKIAQHFIDFINVHPLGLTDITISGSNASYGYSTSSDIDLHLIVKDPPAQFKELFAAKKNHYNNEHDITIHGIDVELYVQPKGDPHHSAGIYSILDDKWIVKPKHDKPNVDGREVRAKARNYASKINQALKSNELDYVKRQWADVKKIRQAGLEQGGEFSVENLAFKLLRSKGKINKLHRHLTKLQNQELSLEESLTPKDIHNLADKKGVAWDNDAEFLQRSKRVTGKSHLDDMNSSDLKKMKDDLEKIKENFANGHNRVDFKKNLLTILQQKYPSIEFNIQSDRVESADGELIVIADTADQGSYVGCFMWDVDTGPYKGALGPAIKQTTNQLLQANPGKKPALFIGGDNENPQAWANIADKLNYNLITDDDEPEEGMAENFADGRNPQDKGDSKRYGVPTKSSVSTLRKVAKQGGRKGQLAHWMANMKAGKKK